MSVENPIPEGSWPPALRQRLGIKTHKVLFCGGALATEPTQTTAPMLVRAIDRQHGARVDANPTQDYEGEPYRQHNSYGVPWLMYQVAHLSLGEARLSMAGYRGSLLTRDTVRKGLEHVCDRFDPRGKLILYGYSGGGFNALEICKELDTMSFDYQTGRLGGGGGPMARPVRVDYLATVDPCRILLQRHRGFLPNDLEQGRGHSTLPRTVPACVLYFDNWYQTCDTIPKEGADWGYRGEWITHPHLEGQHNWRLRRDRFPNHHQAHDAIVEMTKNDVLERFRRFLVPGHQAR
jgi:hypothetical protein